MSETTKGIVAPVSFVNILTVVVDVTMDAHQLKRIATNISTDNAIEVWIAGMHIHESLVNSLQHFAVAMTSYCLQINWM